MAHRETVTTVEGEITEVFAHRVVVRTSEGTVLADLGPKGAKKAAVKAGDRVKLTGRQTPSELKVATFERDGDTIGIEGSDDHKGDRKRGSAQDGKHEPADPTAALAAVTALGHEVVGEPRRKAKHFEVLAKDGAGAHHSHHVALDGEVRKTKAGDPTADKWTASKAEPEAA